MDQRPDDAADGATHGPAPDASTAGAPGHPTPDANPTGPDTMPGATDDATDSAMVEPRSDEVEAFWAVAKEHARLDLMPGYFGPTAIGSVPPPAWAFGGTTAQADELLQLVLAGTKTATASAYWDYEATGEPLPEQGNLSIVVDGGGHPRALLVTTDVDVVPFEDVTEQHAYAEGEGDRSLAHWRRVHEEFFARFRDHDREVGPGMPVVCERFEVLHQQ